MSPFIPLGARTSVYASSWEHARIHARGRGFADGRKPVQKLYAVRLIRNGHIRFANLTHFKISRVGKKLHLAAGT